MVKALLGSDVERIQETVFSWRWLLHPSIVMGIVYGPGKARRCLLAASPAHSAHAPVERGHQAFVVVDGLDSRGPCTMTKSWVGGAWRPPRCYKSVTIPRTKQNKHDVF